MKRRDLLKKVGVGVGALAVSPFTISLLQSCNNDPSWNPNFFKKGDIEFLNELSDLIIPSSVEIPGAKELKLLNVCNELKSLFTPTPVSPKPLFWFVNDPFFYSRRN